MEPFVWNGRYDGDGDDDLRLWQVVDSVTHIPTAVGGTPSYGLVGFQSDEGVHRNHGRTGASQAPDCIRGALANVPYNTSYSILDTGNIPCVGQDLETAQEHLAQRVCTLVSNHHVPIVMGGGHETSFGALLGVHQAIPPTHKIGIINFDAHFDLRHTPDNSPTSGTPFWDVYRTFDTGGRGFHYFCMGIAKSGNTSALFKRAQDLNVAYCTDTECHMSPHTCIQRLVDFVKSMDCVYITIDMDTFCAGVAMGVSAVNPMGIAPAFVELCLQRIRENTPVVGLDVVELNPKYDKDAITARLAGRMIHGFMDFDTSVA